MTRPDNSRVWLITGSSLGLGHQIARAALERGDRVVATARRAESLDELAASAPDRVLAVALDVTSAEQIESAVAEALECDLLAVPDGDLLAMLFTARAGSADAARLREIVGGAGEPAMVSVGQIGPG